MGFFIYCFLFGESFFGCLVCSFYFGKEKSTKAIEKLCLFSLKSHLDLIGDTSFENYHSHSVACVVSCTAYGKLPDPSNMHILAKFKAVQQHHYFVLQTVS